MSDASPDAFPDVHALAQRLSLRTPQRDALALLARVAEVLPLSKARALPLDAALAAVQRVAPHVADFERDFPSLAFALATGVGKTRLMGACAAYLHRVHGVRHFFVLAPNLTIYQKLIADFTPGTRKYVFQGLAEFATTPPLVITGDTYASSLAVRGQDLFGQDDRVHINVFNIAKLAKDAKTTGGGTPRIKRLTEYLGESYFDYLARLDDLVLMMDESHRYRAEAGVKVLNELRPVLGIELTATPHVEKAGRSVPFRNVAYRYPLASAIADGYVKEPAVGTRENFDPAAYSDAELERLKLADGVHLHEATKADLFAYAAAQGERPVKPFLLVVAQDTTHAEALKAHLESPQFLDGRYAGKVITVHSNQRGEESDVVVQALLRVEDPDEPTEIVVHVDKLKEGWDVTNLYTIVPLRAANSRVLVEQSIGRGLRLPYGRKTGVAAVDRLTIVSHDRFQEIVDAANNPNSVIRQTVVIGRDVPERGREPKVVEPSPVAAAQQRGQQALGAAGVQAVQAATRKAIEAVQRSLGAEALPNADALRQPAVRAAVVAAVRERMPDWQTALPLDARPTALLLADAEASYDPMHALPPDVAALVEGLLDAHAQTISIPRIVVEPVGEVTSGFRPFRLDVSRLHFQPVEETLLVQHLQSGERHRVAGGGAAVVEARPEDYVVRALLDYDDVDYQANADLLYDLASQVVAHLRSYLPHEDEVENVLQYHERAIGHYVHAQMQQHFEQCATGYRASVSRGFEVPRPLAFTVETGSETVDLFAAHVEPSRLRGAVFTGMRKCAYPQQTFDSSTERSFAQLLEYDPDVQAWFRPVRDQIQLHLPGGRRYEPDFVVETQVHKYLCETKMRKDLGSDDVQAKRAAAETWCRYASEHEASNEGKPWRYLLVAHDQVRATATLSHLYETANGI